MISFMAEDAGSATTRMCNKCRSIGYWNACEHVHHIGATLVQWNLSITTTFIMQSIACCSSNEVIDADWRWIAPNAVTLSLSSRAHPGGLGPPGWALEDREVSYEVVVIDKFHSMKWSDTDRCGSALLVEQALAPDVWQAISDHHVDNATDDLMTGDTVTILYNMYIIAQPKKPDPCWERSGTQQSLWCWRVCIFMVVTHNGFMIYYKRERFQISYMQIFLMTQFIFFSLSPFKRWYPFRTIWRQLT